MNLNEEILDEPKPEQIPNSSTDKRTIKDLTIVIGILYLIFSLAIFYYSYSIISSVVDVILLYGYRISDIHWTRLLLQNSPFLIYASFFLVSSIGLLRRARWGWTASLAITLYALLFPVLVVIRTLFASGKNFNFPNWLIATIFVVFGLVFSFLISNSTRNYFTVKRRNQIISVSITVLLLIHLFMMPLFQQM